MRLRVVSYAINGRGLGHLTRQLAILRQLRRACAVLDVQSECWVVTSSEGDTLARREGIPSLKMPSKAMFRDAGIDPSVMAERVVDGIRNDTFYLLAEEGTNWDHACRTRMEDILARRNPTIGAVSGGN